MKVLNLLPFLLILSKCFEDVLESDYIKELHQKSFVQFLKDNEFVLLEFYTEGCPHCEEFAPVYLELAKEINFIPELSKVKVAKIDGQKYEEITNSYKVQGFPDIKLLSVHHNFQADYYGERKVEPLLKFVRSRINKKMQYIGSIEQLKQIEETKKLSLIICGNNETHPDAFTAIHNMMMNHDDLESFFTNETTTIKDLNCSPDKLGIVMLKNYDEKRLSYESLPFNLTTFGDWFGVFSLPTLVKLTDENVQVSLQQNIPSIILITKDEDSTETRKMRDMFHTRAKRYRNQLIFMTSSNNSEVAYKLLEYYNINTLPAVVALSANYDSNSFHKFKYEYEEINGVTLDVWIADFFSNKLNKYYQSEPIPQNPINDSVTIVVGHTFKQLVLDTDKDVFLELYAPWCSHCHKLEPKYHRLAKKLAQNENLIIAKMDGNSNEFEGLELQAFPTLFLFKGGKTGKEKLAGRIKFTGTKNVSSMIEFLKNSTHHKIEHVAQLEKEAEIEEEERIDEETENFEQEEENNFNKPSTEDDDENIDWEKEVTDELKGDLSNLNLDELTSADADLGFKDDEENPEDERKIRDLLKENKDSKGHSEPQQKKEGVHEDL